MDDVKASLFHVSDMCMICKVGKEAKIWYRYNQVPHLTQNTLCDSDKSKKNIRYRRAKKSTLFKQVAKRLHDTVTKIKQREPQNKKTHKRSTALECSDVPLWNVW